VGKSTLNALNGKALKGGAYEDRPNVLLIDAEPDSQRARIELVHPFARKLKSRGFVVNIVILGDLKTGRWGYLPTHYTARGFDPYIATHERGSLVMRMNGFYIMYCPLGFFREESNDLDFELMPVLPSDVTPKGTYRYEIIMPASVLQPGRWGILRDRFKEMPQGATVIKLNTGMLCGIGEQYRRHEGSLEDLFIHPLVTELQYSVGNDERRINIS